MATNEAPNGQHNPLALDFGAAPTCVPIWLVHPHVCKSLLCWARGEIAIGASNSKSTESIPLRPTQLIANCHYTKCLKDIIYTIALKKIDPTISIC